MRVIAHYNITESTSGELGDFLNHWRVDPC